MSPRRASRRVCGTTQTDLLELWTNYGLAAGWAPATIRCRRDVLLLLAFRAERDLEDVDALQLAEFLARYPDPATRQTYYKHARSYFSWLRRAGFRLDDPTDTIPRPRVPQAAPRPVSTAALEDAFAVAKPKAFAQLTLAAYAGLRVHEIAKIRGEDVDTIAGTLRVCGKWGSTAVIPLHPRIAALVMELGRVSQLADGKVSRGYLSASRNLFQLGTSFPPTRTDSCGRPVLYPTTGYWFPWDCPRGHVTGLSVGLAIKKTFANAGHPDVVAHQVRHWYGTEIMRAAGGNIRVAQECLRHRSPVQTALYTLVEDVDRRAAVLGLPG